MTGMIKVGCEFCNHCSGWDFELDGEACYCDYLDEIRIIKVFKKENERDKYRYFRDSDLSLKPIPIPRWCANWFELNTEIYHHDPVENQNILKEGEYTLVYQWLTSKRVVKREEN